ncbi:MAG: lipoprotein-releasing ABC transporter permease subunit [Alphaproteobacteria bacterium]|nr:lipoprotein-releasing ABC transporter permease subunit [Alphaproteobacteria bacterium]MDE2335709.1 lipoprotein-releasing ABC transporter permease subunit [Alphaproteobacteria bacterium]
MSFAFERMVAGRYLRSKRREGFISVIAGFSFLGILLGVATLIIVMAVMNGFRVELVGRILGLNGHINVYSRVGPLYPYEPVIQKIEKIPGVTSATPSVEGQALLTANGMAGGVVIRGLTPEDFFKKPILSTSILRKMPDDKGFGGDEVAIGKNLAEQFHIDIGDRLVLIAPKGKTTPFGTIPRDESFIVGSVFDVGMYEYNSGFVFMPLAAAQRFLDMGQGVSTIEIMTPDPSHFGATEDAIRDRLSAGYAVADWRSDNAGFYNALEVESNVMFLILTLIIIVAAFNIISSLIMLVKDKGADIAILRTMGATRGMIVRIFLYTGSAIGIGGTAAGAVTGVVFCRHIEQIREWLQGLLHRNLFNDEIYYLTKLPAKMDPHQTVLIIVLSLALSFLATIYPAWRAARLDPVEALRRE